MKVIDIIRKADEETVAKIVGATVAMNTDKITLDEAMELDYPATLRFLQSDMEIDYKPTNADCIRAMSDEELAKQIAEKIECTECPFNGDEEKCGNAGCSELFLKWLQSEVEE